VFEDELYNMNSQKTEFVFQLPSSRQCCWYKRVIKSVKHASLDDYVMGSLGNFVENFVTEGESWPRPAGTDIRGEPPRIRFTGNWFRFCFNQDFEISSFLNSSRS
jgi:hypothetical protein